MSQDLPTCDEVRAIFDYDAAAGVLRYRNRQGRATIGSVAGSIGNKGYIKIFLRGKTYSAHRLIWLHVHGEFPKTILDHINQVKTDNRIENLREADFSENMQNRFYIAPNSSGHPGVLWLKHKKKWAARIQSYMKQIQVGSFDDINDAIAARKEAVKKYHPLAPKEQP